MPIESFRIEGLDDSETAYVSWDLAEYDPREEDARYDYIDFREGRVYAEFPRWDALERVNACDVRSCHGCCSVPGFCACCKRCGAPPDIDCLCEALARQSDIDDRAVERAIASGW